MRSYVLLLVTLPMFLTGCSRPYQPLSRWERQFFAQARRDVFPDDVRKAHAMYKKTLVAWTGVIKEIKFESEGSSRVAHFTIEHRYFDWIEDWGIQREIFFLSSHGEGLFATAWPVDTPQEQQFIEQFAVGDMMVAYGYPSLIKGRVVGFYPTQNMRAIKPRWYRTDILDYGRPGKPTKLLKKVAF